MPGPSKTSGSKQARKTVKHYKARKEKCKYWSKCYRKEKVHRLEFLHPGDSEEEDSEKGELDVKWRKLWVKVLQEQERQRES